MSKIFCYINSNYIDIKKDGIIQHIILKSIKCGDILSSRDFIDEIKSKKIFSSIVTNSVELLLNHDITEKDKIYYKNIFEDLNCNNIIIKDTREKLNADVLINNYPLYIIYYNNKYYRVIPELLDSYYNYLNISNINIISSSKLENNKKVEYYYYNNPLTFFID